MNREFENGENDTEKRIYTVKVNVLHLHKIIKLNRLNDNLIQKD